MTKHSVREGGVPSQRFCLVTPVFNGVDYIDQTINSVLSQAGDFVLHYHVQDGGSTDGTQEVVRRWQSRLQLGLVPCACRDIVFTFSSQPDDGMYDAINKGMAGALPAGDDVLMGWIGADDLIAPGAFATLTAIRRLFPEYRFFGGRMALLDEHGSITAIGAARPFSRRMMAAGLYDGRGGRAFVMQEGTYWCADLWHAVGGLDPRFKLAGDWDLWRRMAAHEPYITVDTAIGLHRRRRGQLSEQMGRYYAEADSLLDAPITYGAVSTVDPAAIAAGIIRPDDRTTLRAEYDKIADEYQRIVADPTSLRASAHAATTLSFDLGVQRWGRAEAYGAPLLETEVLNAEGLATRHYVHPIAGFGDLQDARPELGVLESFRWLSERDGEGEVVLAQAGLHVVVLRYRAWQTEMTATLRIGTQVVASRLLPAHGHAREVELRLPIRIDGGRRRLSIHIDGGTADSGFLLLTGWFVEEDATLATDAVVAMSEPEWHRGPEGGTSMLVTAPYTGPFVLQILWREEGHDHHPPSLNGDARAARVQSAGPADVRYLVTLHEGANTISPAAGADAGAWMEAIERIALWPTHETLADAVPDGLLDVATGFLAREPADLSSLLPHPFNRAVEKENIAWLASSVAAMRHFIVRVRNRVVGQTITIRLGGEVVGEAVLKKRVAEPTVVHCKGRFDRGFNPIQITPSRIGKDEIDRDLAFYLEEIAFSLPAEKKDRISWEDSSGFGLLEAPVPAQGLPQPFRWMEEPEATIVVDRLHAGRARLTLDARFLGPRQNVVARLNGSQIAAVTVEGLILRDPYPITAEVTFAQGRNDITLSVDAPGVAGRDGRDLYLLVERLDITPES